jgi:hypothetical protein
MSAVRVKNVRPVSVAHARLLLNKQVRYQLINSDTVKVGTVGSAFKSGFCIDGKHHKFEDVVLVELI